MESVLDFLHKTGHRASLTHKPLPHRVSITEFMMEGRDVLISSMFFHAES